MKLFAIMATFACLIFAGCANPPSNSTEKENSQTQAQAQEEVSQAPALQEIPEDAPRQANNAYDYTALLPLFPEIIAGTGRQTLNGQNYKMGSGLVATTNASYSLQDRRFAVAIQDVGNDQNLIPGLAKWSTFTIDAESETDVQRVTTFKNQPAFIYYEKQRRTGSMNVIYNGRFVIDISGRNIEISDLERAMEDMKIERLK